MRFENASSDLKKSTLRSITGLLAKLVYLSELRKSDGKYRHWGLSRVYGEDNAEQAIKTAHCDTVTEILRTPLKQMVEDAVTSSQESGMRPEAYAADLSARGTELLPESVPCHSARHFNAVLHALANLLKRR